MILMENPLKHGFTNKTEKRGFMILPSRRNKGKRIRVLGLTLQLLECLSKVKSDRNRVMAQSKISEFGSQVDINKEKENHL